LSIASGAGSQAAAANSAIRKPLVQILY
jgi:hypothetical protein